LVRAELEEAHGYFFNAVKERRADLSYNLHGRQIAIIDKPPVLAETPNTTAASR
jgi:hypothetical protein